jgi:two-component system response regulator CpxR
MKGFFDENSKPILMIDDDVKLCRLVRDYLSPFGFSVGVAYNGNDGLDKIRSGEYQAVILDVMLPGMDGFTVLKQIRRFSDVPVLMLTALGDESDRIVGLEIGADDYLPKTFSTRELLARLRAVTRRANRNPAVKNNEIDELVVGGIYINQATRETRINNEPVALTALEFDLLLSLMRSAGRVLDRDTLLDAVAGRSYDVFDRSVDVHISSLRRKIGDDSKHPRYIKTIRSVGYMLVSNEADELEAEETI